MVTTNGTKELVSGEQGERFHTVTYNCEPLTGGTGGQHIELSQTVYTRSMILKIRRCSPSS